MKFSHTIEVKKPRDTVTAYFIDPFYLKEYQDGFIRKELISGMAGADGTISKMYYKHGKREMELTETIIANRLPDSFEAHYHHKHMDNSMKCTFTALDDNRTRYETEIEYTAFRGFMPKLFATLFPGMFKKQVAKWLQNFKDFVESQ